MNDSMNVNVGSVLLRRIGNEDRIVLQWSIATNLLHSEGGFNRGFSSCCKDVFGRVLQLFLYPDIVNMNNNTSWCIFEIREIDWYYKQFVLQLSVTVKLSDLIEVVSVHNQNFSAGCCFFRKEKFLALSQLHDFRHNPINMENLKIICSFVPGDDYKEHFYSPLCIIENECFFHKQIEWCISYKRLIDGRTEPSHIFMMKSQSYKLAFTYSDSKKLVFLVLLRKGPPADCSTHFIRWWAEVRLSHGSSHHRNLKGELYLGEPSKTYSQIILDFIHLEELKKYHQFGSVYVVFRLISEKASKPREMCNHGVFKITAPGEGIIQEEDCPSHKQIQWHIKFNVLRCKGNALSPQFVISKQNYKLEISLDKVYAKWVIKLYSDESSIVDPAKTILWWAGMKSSKGNYHFPNGSGKLNLLEEDEVWTQFLHEFNDEENVPLYLTDDKCITIFFRIQKIVKSSVCIHSASLMPLEPGDGFIHEEECFSCKHIKWDVQFRKKSCIHTYDKKFQVFRYIDMASPEFVVEFQHYRLELQRINYTIQVRLFCKRYSSGCFRSVRWWMGLQGRDEIPLCSYTSGVLDTIEFCDLWTLKGLFSVSEFEVKDRLHADEEYLTVFFHINKEKKKGKECTCSTTKMEHVKTDGKIQHINGPAYDRIDWEFKLDSHHLEWWKATSPEFTVAAQQFKMEVSQVLDITSNSRNLELRIYNRGKLRISPSTYLQWHAGIMRSKKSFHPDNLEGILSNQRDNHDLWTLIGSQKIRLKEIQSRSNPTSKITSFFCASRELSHILPNPTNQNFLELQSRHFFGTIHIDTFSCFEQVEWSLDFSQYSPRLHVYYSKTFKIKNDHYSLKLSPNPDVADSYILTVYRYGTFRNYRHWWTGLKHNRDNYHYRSAEGSLPDGNYHLWAPTYLHTFYSSEINEQLLKPSRSLTIFFRLTTEHYGGEIYLNRKRQRKDNVIFEVNGTELTIEKDIIVARVSAFNAMFHYDTIENRIGVVTITDIHPEIFHEFLFYVKFGLLQLKLNVNKALELYVVAHKYMMEDMQAYCLQHICDDLTISDFCDAVRIAILYENEYLLKKAIDFLSDNHNILQTKNWHKFASEDLDRANGLLWRAFLPQERADILNASADVK